MTEDDFRRIATDQGYDKPNELTWLSGRFNEWHTHPFDLFVYIIDGEMTLELEVDGKVETHPCPAGGSIEVPANVRHTERISGADTHFLSAPRHPA
tara:strand:+ start:980 stop:1267 length:288 start_codon:yes stop_codon:yes gene_type:complete